jgi:hypothetical protein
MGFADHMLKTNSLSWAAIGKTALILVGGILIRQFGMLLTNKTFIQAIERRLKKKKQRIIAPNRENYRGGEIVMIGNINSIINRNALID